MPRYDGTGPMGRGSGTGRGAGPCGGGMTRGRSGAERGQGSGWRRFWRNPFTSASPKKEESEMLSEESVILEKELKAIKDRLAEL